MKYDVKVSHQVLFLSWLLSAASRMIPFKSFPPLQKTSCLTLGNASYLLMATKTFSLSHVTPSPSGGKVGQGIFHFADLDQEWVYFFFPVVNILGIEGHML